MQLLRLPAWIACLPLALVLASCAGGGGAPSTVTPGATSANPGSPSANKAAGVVPARFTFLIPLASKHAAARSRKPQYLPATAQSIEIDLVQVNGIAPAPAPSPTIANVGSTAPGCAATIGGLTCTVALGLPIGSDTVLVKAFDAAGATGNVLSQQQSIFAVVQGSANSFAMTLDASPGPILTGPPITGATCSSPPPTCTFTGSSPVSVLVAVADAHGTLIADNTIAGSPILSAMSSDTTIASVTATQTPYGITVTPVGTGTATITLTAAPATGTSGLPPTTFIFAVVVPPAPTCQNLVALGSTAATFAVLGGQSVTNTGPTIVTGDLGVSPGTSITGFPPGIVTGAIHSADAVASQAQSDVTIAYNNAAGQPPTASVPGDLGGFTLVPGVYNASSSIGLTGTLTLDGQGDPNSSFIFQIGSTLTTASASTVTLINGANACNVFWQVGSSATLGTNSTFSGTILALTSINVTTGVVVNGRALARNGSVTLDSNTITVTGLPPPTTPLDVHRHVPGARRPSVEPKAR